MNKTKLNLIIDFILLILLVGMGAIGIMLEYVIPCGHGAGHGCGHGGGAQLWGLGRHDWGDIHWYFGLIFLVFILIHIVLHWKMICGMWKQLTKKK